MATATFAVRGGRLACCVWASMLTLLKHRCVGVRSRVASSSRLRGVQRPPSPARPIGCSQRSLAHSLPSSSQFSGCRTLLMPAARAAASAMGTHGRRCDLTRWLQVKCPRQSSTSSPSSISAASASKSSGRGTSMSRRWRVCGLRARRQLWRAPREWAPLVACGGTQARAAPWMGMPVALLLVTCGSMVTGLPRRCGSMKSDSFVRNAFCPGSDD
mmetsp:Transcript_22674/g.57732  ORF Transcript_22674/g.57732 Transcript_22674/m.57732 type:complete len:215 (+) Transcript_22674:169-813(+)